MVVRMSMSPAEIERKLRQHDNDIAEIYPALGQIQGTLHQHTRRLDELGATLADHTTRLGRLEGSVQQILEIVRDRDTP